MQQYKPIVSSPLYGGRVLGGNCTTPRLCTNTVQTDREYEMEGCIVPSTEQFYSLTAKVSLGECWGMGSQEEWVKVPEAVDRRSFGDQVLQMHCSLHGLYGLTTQFTHTLCPPTHTAVGAYVLHHHYLWSAPGAADTYPHDMATHSIQVPYSVLEGLNQFQFSFRDTGALHTADSLWHAFSILGAQTQAVYTAMQLTSVPVLHDSEELSLLLAIAKPLLNPALSMLCDVHCLQCHMRA
eukprot:2068884-Rhodomonas_salina.3